MQCPLLLVYIINYIIDWWASNELENSALEKWDEPLNISYLVSPLNFGKNK